MGGSVHKRKQKDKLVAERVYSHSGQDNIAAASGDAEQLLSGLAGRILETVWVCSEDWKELHYVCPGLEPLWGIKPDELRDDPLIWLARIDDRDRAMVEQAIRNLDLAGDCEAALPEYRIEGRDGTPRWISSFVYEIDPDSGSGKLAVVSRDITRIVESRNNARLTDDRFRALFDQTNDAIFIHDMKGDFLEVNEAACERLGYSRDELLSMTVKDIDAPEFQKKLKGKFEELLIEKRKVLESAHMTRDGVRVPVEISARLIDYNGSRAVLSVARDITGRKEAENRLRQQSEMMQALIDNIPVMLTWFDNKTQLSGINQEISRRLGWTEEDIAVRDMMELCFPDPETRKEAREYMLEGSMKWKDFELTCKDGSVSTSSWSNVRLTDGKFIGIGIDISEKRAEERAIETLVETTAVSSGRQLFDRVVTIVSGWLDADGTMVGLFGQEKTVRTVSLQLDGDPGGPLVFDLQSTPCRHVREQEFVHIESGLGELYPQNGPLSGFGDGGYVGVLLRDKAGEPMGVLAAFSRKPLTLPPWAEKVLRIIAARLGVELERMAAEEALEFESRANRAVAELARRLIDTADIGTICSLVIDSASQLTGSPGGFAAIVDRQTGEVCPGNGSEQDQAIFTNSSNQWKQVLKKREPLIDNNVAEGGGTGGEFGRFLGVPAMIGERTFGVVSVAGADRDYLESDQIALERIAALFAIVMQRSEEQAEYRKLSVAVEQSPNSIMITDPVGRIEYVNPRLCEITGFSREEILGRQPNLVKSGDTPPEVYRDMWDTIKAGNVWQGELLNAKKNGEKYWELVSIAPLKNGDGEITHFIQVKEDISRQKEAEKELQAARDEMEQRVLDRTARLVDTNARLLSEIEMRNLSEQALRKERDKAQRYLDLAGVMFVALDKEGMVSMINRRGVELLGWPEKEIVGRDWFDTCLPEADRETVRGVFKLLMSGEVEGARYVEGKVLTHSGEERTIAWHNTILRDESGESTGTLSSGEDITVRKQVQSELDLERSRLEVMLRHESLVAEVAGQFNSESSFGENLRTLLARMGDTAGMEGITIWEIDEDRGTAEAYGSWNRGRRRKCKLEKSFGSADLPAFFGRIMESHTMVYNTGQLPSDIAAFFKLDSDIAMLCYPLSFGGQVKGAISFIRKQEGEWSSEEVSLFRAVSEIVTNAWERDTQVRARIDAERRHTESVQLVERATRLASIGVISAGITHEINQPLNAIRLTADGSVLWLERNNVELPEKFVDRLGKISSHVERITRIIKHMREFWANTERPDTAVFDLREAVGDALGLVEQQIFSHGIKLEQTHDGHDIPVSGDRLHMEQIVINLVVNSMQALDDAGRDDGAISIHTRIEDNSAILEVRDNGPGFGDADMDKIFDLFYSTKKPGEGTGLGLAIVKKYSEELGGEVRAENVEDNGGALFRVRLPLNS